MTLLRKLEHEKLRSLSLSGEILDLGGSPHAPYHALIANAQNRIFTVNSDPAANPDLLADLEEGIPLENGRFDAVLAMNLLEHIYHHEELIREAARVLKRGGIFVVLVPFLHHIHPSPGDYFRYSDAALQKLLVRAGFSEVKIEPLGYGVMSACVHLLQNVVPGILHPFLEKLARGADWLLLRFARACRRQYVPSRYPLGYFVVCRTSPR